MSVLSELSQLKGTKAKTPEERAQQRKENSRDNKAAYLFLIPWFIGLAVITIGPMIASLYLSFTNYNLLQPPEWIGIDNYSRMLEDDRL
ncbi:MAG: ABC transporter permease, partial [Cryobacterium sp.]|nr:ABC transporter permease [Cryobacterium sp.]